MRRRLFEPISEFVRLPILSQPNSPPHDVDYGLEHGTVTAGRKHLHCRLVGVENSLSQNCFLQGTNQRLNLYRSVQSTGSALSEGLLNRRAQK